MEALTRTRGGELKVMQVRKQEMNLSLDADDMVYMENPQNPSIWLALHKLM